MPGILVHICCAPDGLYVMSLLREKYDASGFFYNPNIYPLEEYSLRLKETRRIARILPFHLYEGEYDSQNWEKLIEKFKDEPEKGRRCDICYAIRLHKTAQKANELGINSFTTVMSLSPWKKAYVLNRMGSMFAKKYGLHFLDADFKKKDGFKKSIDLSRRYHLYRQNYCGCRYSKKDKIQT